jgi:hypothetical protein
MNKNEMHGDASTIDADAKKLMSPCPIFFSDPLEDKILYSEFFLRLAIGFYMLIFQPPVNICSDENIQTIFGLKLQDFSNYRIDYNSISQTVENVVKKIFFSAPKASKSGDRQVLVEPTMALLWRPLDVLLFRRPKNIFFTTFSTVWDIEL